jgi:malate synthase
LWYTGGMTTTQTVPHATLPHATRAAARLVEEVYNDQAPDRAAGVEAAQVAAWTAAQLIERLFGLPHGAGGPRLGATLEARAAAHDLLDCGGGEWARGAWVGADLDAVREVTG